MLLNNFDTLLYISFCFALYFLLLAWTGWVEKIVHRKALISHILQQNLPYHLTMFTLSQAHQNAWNIFGWFVCVCVRACVRAWVWTFWLSTKVVEHQIWLWVFSLVRKYEKNDVAKSIPWQKRGEPFIHLKAILNNSFAIKDELDRRKKP